MSQSGYVADIQVALAEKGFDPGPIDGAIGPLTKAAVESFQEANGLRVDGDVGPETFVVLNPYNRQGLEQYDHIPWYRESLALNGIVQFTNGSNPAITGRGGYLDISYGSDEIYWCGLHAGYCLRKNLPSEPLPDNPLGARNYLGVGVEVSPKEGAIMVFWRESKESWKGHVGFYHGERGNHYEITGGNQSKSVNISLFRKDKLLGARWPATA